VLIGLLGFAFHRLRRTAGEATAPLPIELLAQQALGPGQSLHLVRCGDKRLLLGVTAHQITLIDRLPPEQEAAPVSAPVSPAPAEFSTFLYRALRPSPHGH
jgi:flagellar biogenesis protein FliO